MRRWFRRLAVGLAAVMLLGGVAFAWLAWQVDLLGQQDNARPSDVIVVLGAKVEQDGQPGADLASRTEHAVALWRSKFAPTLICCGGIKGEPLSAAAVCRRYASSLGVPSSDIMLADGTSDTLQDAQAAAELMRQHGWRTAILVSHPLHLYRSRWLFQRAGVTAFTSPTNTATDRIDLPVRVYYALRESAAIVITALVHSGWLPLDWRATLDEWRFRFP
jgi:uncharacterized SAM-binding protein YcdF (DUF218 family)